MDFRKPKKQDAIDIAILGGGAVAGGMVSRGLYGAIHEPKAVTAEEIKKEKMIGYAKRVALIAAGLYVASGITSKDSASTGAKGALIGVAVSQGLDLVKDVAADSTVGQNAQAGTTAKDKFTARALGLGCPCDGTPALGRPRHRRNSRLRMPMVELPESIASETAVNSLEARLEKTLG